MTLNNLIPSSERSKSAGSTGFAIGLGDNSIIGISVCPLTLTFTFLTIFSFVVLFVNSTKYSISTSSSNLL